MAKLSEMRGAIAVSNRRRTPLKLVIEPWANEASLAPGDQVRIEFAGPQDGTVELEVKDEALVIYGWQGSVLSDPTPVAPEQR